MYLLQAASGFTWKEILLGGEEWSFLLETVLRSFIMFVIILISLRILGKRGVKQLSVFELVVIIGLGSAAGDPMFYKDVGILPALIVFVMVVGLYSFIVSMVGKNKHFEALIEGKPVCLIKEGVFSINNFKKEVLGEDEFFTELRLKSVSQLGQIEEAILESSGDISIFYYPDEAVKYGLPIMPKMLETPFIVIKETAHYSCIFCGYTKELQPLNNHNCPLCTKNEWVKSSNKKRIT
ncbi:MAG TPA: YetF domain-containing protein [Ferruginibacter sp.]|nr:YetF domain-containing protein [Ferruginibacter sp.]